MVLLFSLDCRFLVFTDSKFTMSNIILILGASPNVGLSLATYSAVVGRNPSPDLSSAADLAIGADFQDPKSIKSAFEKVKVKLGVPNAVVHNGQRHPNLTFQMED